MTANLSVSEMHSLVEKIVEENSAMLLSKLKTLVNDVMKPKTTHRTFTKAESSAIYRLEVEGEYIDVMFHSNPSHTYRYSTNESFRSKLIEILSDPDCQGMSVGRLIHEARACGVLVSV